MRVLIVIPARAGSKGVPRKNMREVAGVPLFVHSVRAALEYAAVNPDTRIVVSSDDLELLMAAAAFDGVTAMYRDPELATDAAPTDAVLVHVLQELQLQEGYRPDLVVLLQPTVPVRRAGLVADSVAELVGSGNDSILSAYPLHFVWWRESPAYRKEDSWPSPYQWRTQCHRRPMRQSMEARELMFHEDGAVYVCKTELLETVGRRVGEHPEVIENERTVDIDTEEDLVVADALLRARARTREETAA